MALDMRRSFDAPAMIAEHIVRCNPFPGHPLVFSNRRSDRPLFGSDNGGRTAALPSSFVASGKPPRIDAFASLRDVFPRISAHPHNRLEELLPDGWAAARAAHSS